ncbi:hypothetical protein CCR75_005863 [Bremia lactucae]|uniref:Uncharacterized protein n=1 Tax=Bremia lactucae TaxID=4779 RepID=A0A976IC60_BRELC|nr:hypothetical protein CCR75_005863 [Bremia lactucae]
MPRSSPLAASSSIDPWESSTVLSTTTFTMADSVNTDENEVVTAEFSVDLADGQTWAVNFFECAAENDLECLEEILDSGRVRVNDVDVDGFTALMVAAAEGHRDVVRTLLKRGADVRIQTHELRSTALHFAAKNGDAVIVAALCECDASMIDCWNSNGDTPLIWACIEGRVEAVKVFLKYGADVTVLNQYGASTLLCAVMVGEDPEEVEEIDEQRAEILTMLLATKKVLVNFQDPEGSTAMHLAMSCGYLACIKTLLANGADITLRNVIGQTALEEALDVWKEEREPCIAYVRGIWQQLEEEAAARMMAMLEIEDKADKRKTGGNSVLTSKKSKKKNKKVKRKAIKQPHFETMKEESKALMWRSQVESVSTVKEDDESGESSDEERLSLMQAIGSSLEQDSEDKLGDMTAVVEVLEAIEESLKKDVETTADAWTTVRKKPRSALVVANDAVKTTSSLRHKTVLSTSKRGQHSSLKQQSHDTISSSGGRVRSSSAPRPGVAHNIRSTPGDERSTFSIKSRASRHLAPSHIEDSTAQVFKSLDLTNSMSCSNFSWTLSSPWRPEFRRLPALAPHVVTQSTNRQTWKQQRTNGPYKVACDIRDRWLGKLHLGNENVAETLGYLACGLCGELVNDNRQCSGSASKGTDSLDCPQLYCASCLESSAFQTAHSTTFKCVRCHQVTRKETMSCNSFAQAQAASLGLSLSNSFSTKAFVSYSLEDMQHLLEASDYQVSGVDLQAYYLVPGSDLCHLSNGQLDILANAHQRGLTEILDQRLTNARATERLHLDEWLKTHMLYHKQ